MVAVVVETVVAVLLRYAFLATTVLSTSLGKTFFVWYFILDEIILF